MTKFRKTLACILLACLMCMPAAVYGETTAHEKPACEEPELIEPACEESADGVLPCDEPDCAQTVPEEEEPAEPPCEAPVPEEPETACRIAVQSVTATTVAQYFGIRCSFSGAERITVSFDGLRVTEKSDMGHSGAKSVWEFPFASAAETVINLYFRPGEGTAPGTYRFTVSVEGAGHTHSAEGAVTLDEVISVPWRKIRKVYNQKDYEEYWMPNDYPVYPEVSVRCETSSRTLASSGCGIFTVAHAIEWLTGTNPDIETVRDHCGNTASYRYGMSVSAMDYLEQAYGITHTAATGREAEARRIFDNGGILIAATPNFKHYFLAVEYLVHDNSTYIHIIDSSTGTTLSSGYRGYWIDTLERISAPKAICTSGLHGEGHDYWIKIGDLQKNVLLALYNGTPAE